jgi:signal transduction histidine kinase
MANVAGSFNLLRNAQAQISEKRARHVASGWLGAAAHEADRQWTNPVVKSLIGELTKVRERERHKIADELHDRIGQNLVLAMLKLRLIENSAGPDLSSLPEIRQLISEVIEETRTLVCDLHPQQLTEQDFESGLDWLIQETQRRYGLPCVAQIVSLPPLNRATKETLFRAIRELLINAGKHAQARKARVLVSSKKGRLVVRVSDDGKGLLPSHLYSKDPKIGGFGLLSLRRDLTDMGGSLHIKSSPGRGTRVMIALPINV